MYKFVITFFFFAVFGMFVSSCSDWGLNNLSSPTPSPSPSPSKVSSMLLLQIALRREQLANSTPERSARMQEMGMNTGNLNNQRVYIYLKQQLTDGQARELRDMGITVYPESWIPPVGNNPEGFYLADIPVDKLESLAEKSYVVRLDTAEKRLQPQSDKR